jgi:hypothetical protein
MLGYTYIVSLVTTEMQRVYCAGHPKALNKTDFFLPERVKVGDK